CARDASFDNGYYGYLDLIDYW
nr:immunoglobulin heavy chain junction region [Macaca mulatta]MOV53671.1 immunoglobulin heavy chain junction region [Macaca mulatta]MOV54324.1 immunoglobulin heavy chain junction region [Macaca mulatta]MOV54394.1 immunoglobulin heavy chain junction region [Macaca mulatta]MOV54714.1 immunoglobulin heavy chain junction region [Macaca mulatta]